MDGYRTREQAGTIGNSERLHEERQYNESLKIYQAIVVNFDEEKVFANSETIGKICEILSNVEKDMIYSEQKALQENGISFSNSENGDPAYFDCYRSEGSDIAATKTKYFLIDRIIEKYRDNPVQLEQMLKKTAAYLPEQTLTTLGMKFNDGKLNDKMLEIAAQALQGRQFYERMYEATHIPSYGQEYFYKTHKVMPLLETLLDKDLLNEQQVDVIRRLRCSHYKFGHYDLSRLRTVLTEKWGTYLTPKELWDLDTNNENTQPIEYWKKRNWNFENETDKIEMITRLGKSFHYDIKRHTDPEKNQIFTQMAKDILSQLDENNPKEILAWLSIFNELKSTFYDKLSLAEWLQSCLPENKITVFNKTLQDAIEHIKQDKEKEKRLSEISKLSNDNKNINQIFNENLYYPQDAYCFIYHNTKIFDCLCSFDSETDYQENSSLITSKGNTYEAIRLGRCGYTFLIDTQKMKQIKPYAVNLIVPKEAAGIIIGKGGKNIKNLNERYKKNFKIKEMPPNEIELKKEYSFKLLNEEELEQLKEEKNKILENKNNQTAAQEILSNKIYNFSPAAESDDKEELTAKYAVSQLLNKDGHFNCLPYGIANFVLKICDKNFTKDYNQMNKKMLSDQMQQNDIENEQKQKEIEEENKRRQLEDEERRKEEERNNHINKISEDIITKNQNKLVFMDDKAIILNITNYINENKDELPINLNAKDLLKLRDNLIKKRNETPINEKTNNNEIQTKINSLKNEILASDITEEAPIEELFIEENENSSFNDSDYETPNELSPEEKAAKKAALKEAKKAAKQSGKKLSGGLSGLASLLNNGNDGM